MGKYTVGLPKGVYTGAEWARRVRIAGAHVNEMAQNFIRGYTAFVNGPALQVASQRFEAWIRAFFGTGVPVEYARAILRAKQQYQATKYRLAGGGVAPAPAPAPA